MKNGQIAICKEPGHWENVPCIISEIIDFQDERMAVILSNIRIGAKIVPVHMLDRIENHFYLKL